jgi:hypothetical protein
MTRLDNRHRAVLRAYLERPAFRVLAASIAADVLLLSVIGYAVWYDRGNVSLTGFFGELFEVIVVIALLGPYILFVVFAALMMQHLREQLSDPRAAFVPGFIRPQVVVGAVLLTAVPVAGMVIFLGIVHLFFELHGVVVPQAVGALAVLMCALAVAAWMAAFKSPWLALLVLPLALLTLTSHFLMDLFGGMINPAPSAPAWRNFLPYSLLVLDAAALWALFRYLGGLSYRDPDGSRRLTRVGARPRGDSPISLRPHRALSSPLSRAWHRRSGVLSPAAPWLVAGSLGAVLLVAAYVFGGNSSDLLRSLLLPTVVPGVVISLIWRERWMNLGYESLYPADREQFVQELLTATAISLAELWLATAVAVLPPVLIFTPHLLTTPMFLVTLTASAVMQVLVFGIMFLSALFRPMLPYVNVVTILAQLIPISFAWADQPELSQRGLLTVAVAEMIIGVLITSFGYSSWRRADLA